jgi:signal transduction histidine kinase
VKHLKNRLLRTTAVRLAIKAVLLYGFLLAAVLTALYWAASSGFDEQLERQLEQDINGLARLLTRDHRERLNSELQRLQQQDRIVLLVSAEGDKLAGNLRQWPQEAAIELDGKTRGLWIEEDVIPPELYDDDAYWPVVALGLNDGKRLLLAQQVEQSEDLLELSEFLIEAMGIALVFAVFIAVVLGRQILGRMDVISTTAGEIMNGNLAQRIPLSGKQDEFDTLADRLNAMLERIQQLIKGIREVTDNVAHDLRSPLTRLRNHMEITLLEPRSPDEYQQVLRQSIEEIESLITTFNALLSIAQAEAGNNRVQWTQVDLKQLAMDLMDLYTPLTEAKAQTLGVINGDDAIILGNRDLLTQSLGNLLENAIKFTPNGGNIRLQIKVSKNQVEVIVADSGPGIPEAEKSRVLEKFVRLDSSRHTPGNGLGLSLVAAVASLHKAELILKDGDPGLQVIQRFNKTT